MWVEELCGFSEGSVADVAAQFAFDAGSLTSSPNGRSMQVGRFETPSLADLRARCEAVDDLSGGLTVRENGYAFPTIGQLSAIGSRIEAAPEAERSDLMGALQIGMQWDTEVTLKGGATS